MAVIRQQPFGGIVPRLSANLLTNGQAQTALNTKLYSGEIRPWRQPVEIETPLATDATTIYRLTDGATEKWLSWSEDVDIAPSQIADSADVSIYYTTYGSTPKKTNITLATTGSGPWPAAYRSMGVTAPSSAPTLAKTDGSGTSETRAYVYTNVSTFGSVLEESAPSTATSISLLPTGGSVTISGFSSAAISGQNITHRRIYRSLTGSYLLVAEIPVSTTSYVDSLTAAAIPGDALPSLDWNEPPADLHGLVNMPNGMMAGFVGKQVHFCEPYYPHAWPDIYSVSVESNIVGLGVFGSTLVVATEGRPYVISGIHPSSMTQEKLPLLEPCVSKKSITQDRFGVLYASPNGLVAIGPGSMDVISKPLYTRDDWQILTPTGLAAEIYDGNYIATYGDEGKAIVLSRSDNPALTELQWNARALYVDQINAQLYGISNIDNKLYQFDADPYNNISYQWRSPRFVVNAPTAFTCFQFDADYNGVEDTAALIAANEILEAANESLITSGTSGEMNAATFNTYALNGSALATLNSIERRAVTVTFYADDVLIHSQPVSSLEPLRLPPVRAYTWEIEISGTVAARSVYMATSIAELRMG